MISKIAKGIVPALVSLIAIKATVYLQSLQMPRYLAILIAACLAASAAVIADVLIDGARRHILTLRKILDKRARFEGDWFVKTAEGSRMPYGAISIDYNAESDVFTYSGAAYDQKGNLASEWSCENLQFDIPHSKVRFVCRTSIKGGDGAQHESYGWISFKKTHLRRRLRYARGDGFFTVIGKPELKGEFSLERLDRRYVKSVLGGPHIGTKEEMAKIVSAYHLGKSNVTEPDRLNA